MAGFLFLGVIFMGDNFGRSFGQSFADSYAESYKNNLANQSSQANASLARQLQLMQIGTQLSQQASALESESDKLKMVNPNLARQKALEAQSYRQQAQRLSTQPMGQPNPSGGGLLGILTNHLMGGVQGFRQANQLDNELNNQPSQTPIPYAPQDVSGRQKAAAALMGFLRPGRQTVISGNIPQPTIQNPSTDIQQPEDEFSKQERLNQESQKLFDTRVNNLPSDYTAAGELAKKLVAAGTPIEKALEMLPTEETLSKIPDRDAKEVAALTTKSKYLQKIINFASKNPGGSGNIFGIPKTLLSDIQEKSGLDIPGISGDLKATDTLEKYYDTLKRNEIDLVTVRNPATQNAEKFVSKTLPDIYKPGKNFIDDAAKWKEITDSELNALVKKLQRRHRINPDDVFNNTPDEEQVIPHNPSGPQNTGKTVGGLGGIIAGGFQGAKVGGGLAAQVNQFVPNPALKLGVGAIGVGAGALIGAGAGAGVGTSLGSLYDSGFNLTMPTVESIKQKAQELIQSGMHPQEAGKQALVEGLQQAQKAKQTKEQVKGKGKTFTRVNDQGQKEVVIPIGDMLNSVGGDFTKNQEGFRDTTYLDEGGNPTIGYGSTRINGQPVKPGMKITKEQAQKQYTQDAGSANKLIDNTIQVPLTKFQREALKSFIYNAGPGAFSKNQIAELINHGQVEEAARRMHQFVYVDNGPRQKKVSQGLVNRRKKETQMLLAGQQ